MIEGEEGREFWGWRVELMKREYRHYQSRNVVALSLVGRKGCAKKLLEYSEEKVPILVVATINLIDSLYGV